MLRIGDFSKLSQVSVKTLRYYDEVGLLRPMQTDRFTSYRYYGVEQLPRLNRILALKDLGLSLEQIAHLLDENVSASELRGILRLKQDELRQQIDEQQSRLSRIEIRLKQIEQEAAMSMSPFDVVIKSIEPQTTLYIHETIPTYAGISQLFTRAFTQMGRLGLRPAGPPIGLFYDTEYREQDIDVEVDIPVAATLTGKEVALRQLPGGLMACLVHRGSYDSLGPTYTALITWIESNAYRIVGPGREVYLRGSESGDPTTYVTELQFPVEKA
jgi:effector-binding domain-containing protein